MRWIAAIASLLMAINSAALGGIIVTGQRDDRVLISNPPGDWHSPAGARYSLDWLSGGLDAGKAGDAEGYRLFGGRDSNAMTTSWRSPFVWATACSL